MTHTTHATIAPPSPVSTETASRSPLVSVVIVCYNQARFLADAIKSAFALTHPRLEVLIVDDGSTDDTAEVARAYPLARYLHQSNKGLSAARNTGLRAAKGDYVLFLDADDRLTPRAATAGLELFRRSPDSAFVFGAYRRIQQDGSPAPTEEQAYVGSGHFARLLETNFIGMHGTVLYRRDVLKAAGGFDESLRACEDYDVYLRLSRYWPTAQHREVVAEYRQHEGNMSKDSMFMLQSVLGVLERQRPNLQQPEHVRALRRGIKIWKTYYAGRLFEEWKVERGALRLWNFAALHPTGFLRRLGAGARRRALEWSDRHLVRFGGLRRLSPVSQSFGWDRGLPVDRYYVESFLTQHAAAVRGRVLEIGGDDYSRKYGGERITAQDILHIEQGQPGVTIVADLTCARLIPDNRFDCIILTQTLHYIFDLEAAIRTVHRVLKPGGTVIATLPGISRLCTDQKDKESDCWRFTPFSARRLFRQAFGEANVELRSYGNVLTASAFLQGLAAHELRAKELDHHDSDFPVLLAIAAKKEDSRNDVFAVSLEDFGSALSPDRNGSLGPLVPLRDS